MEPLWHRLPLLGHFHHAASVQDAVAKQVVKLQSHAVPPPLVDLVVQLVPLGGQDRQVLHVPPSQVGAGVRRKGAGLVKIYLTLSSNQTPFVIQTAVLKDFVPDGCLCLPPPTGSLASRYRRHKPQVCSGSKKKKRSCTRPDSPAECLPPDRPSPTLTATSLLCVHSKQFLLPPAALAGVT